MSSLRALPHSRWSEPPRKLLLYNHNPKAGGGSVYAALDLAIGQRCSSVLNATPDCWATVHEECFSGREEQAQFFVLGSVREPCDHYLSLWAFGSAGRGVSPCNQDKEASLCKEQYGKDPPYFNSSADVNRFHRWMGFPSVQGEVAHRFMNSYVDAEGETFVDCWVVTDRFLDSLFRCLRMFASQGGRTQHFTTCDLGFGRNFGFAGCCQPSYPPPPTHPAQEKVALNLEQGRGGGMTEGDMAPLAIALSAVVKAMPNQFNVPLEHDRSNTGALLADAGYATGFTGKFHVGPLWTQEQLLEYSSANHSDRLGMSNLFCRNELTAREIIRRTYGFTWAKHVYDQNMRQPFAEHNPDWTLAAAHEFLEAHQQQAFYLHVCTTLMHGTPGSWARALDFPAVSGEGLLGW
ncbi:hypothetical protein EMIHUDRAFT_220067 [Emiliania huxleyi CCMP1516]|uniref:Sulfatase N-terminal domain-containing protein n=2 Tax=Emiliania huxleyi TaxID=2903 RepID=A0A0D3I2Y6_EMIH1|nr:hypothetical protein EMIHUDRAFT_220067 [Emiliania huxleyi CCMP1516]EOD05621.1 hypothetical protein EMIHUDRAFT_220067 [Emiliania huxleyi CCMP1516]|eukprot:XP_005758050.1 hypothetical protein EMIHUDRAFT_220067 [Emiliania huxleyi CCMP1516]